MKLIPDKPLRTESSAEKRLFEKLSKSNLPDNWHCFHSLSLSRHMKKREGEIDFLFINPRGVLVLEVKGGRVARQNGEWLFTNRHGETTIKHESPFEQAKTAMYSLRDTVSHLLGSEYNQLLFGYGAAFPDIEFTVNSPEWDPDMVYSLIDKGDIEGYLLKLQDYWTRKTSAKQSRAKELTKAQLNNLSEFLRGEFDLIKPLSKDIAELEEEFIKLTREQSNCLAQLEENDRVWVTGPAGTGKTLLAYERARLNQQRCIRTLFLCYNKFLAGNLRYIYHQEFQGQEKFVDFYTIHSYMMLEIEKLLGSQALEGRARDSSFYNNYLPHLFKGVADKIHPYDYLILDEAQDVMTPTYIEPLGATLHGGWQSGSWNIFLDPENQKNMFAQLDENIVAQLKGAAAKYRLDKNCRNTKSIAKQCEIVSTLDCGSASALEGLKVKFIWYENDFDQSVKLSEAINKVLESGVPAGDITILSREKSSHSLAGSGRLRINAKLQEYRVDMPSQEKHSSVSYSTVQSYKGLESPVIVLTDVVGMEDGYDNLTNYVGMTRARSYLIVAVHKTLRKNYNNKVKALV